MSFLSPDVLTTPPELFSYGFLLLMLYSFLGWCGEMVYCSIGQRKLCEKRGFLNGPLCPIYGHGALVVLIALRGGCENPIATFFLGGILTSAVEYITSYAMEKLFRMRWWDYSHYKLHIHGRVCLLNSTLFGLASVALCHWIHPVLSDWILRFFETGWAIPLALILTVLYLADIVLSVRSAVQIGSRLKKLHAIQEELREKLASLRAEQERAIQERRQKLEEDISSVLDAAAQRREQREAEIAQRLETAKAEAQEKLRALYEKQDFLERRLMRSYPTLRSIRHSEALAKLQEYLDEKKAARRKK